MNQHPENDTEESKAQPQCILCGRCLEVCPLLAATGREELSPRAKLFLVQRLASDPEALAASRAESLASLCLTCGRCAEACPQGADVPAVVSGLRAAHPGFVRWLWKAWIGGSGVLWPAAARLGAAVGGRIPGGGGVVARMGRSLAAMGARSPIRPWIEPGDLGSCPPAGKVVLFPGCLASSVRRDWTDKAHALLALAGAEILPTPAWSCCGGTLGHAGLAREELAAMRANLRVWREAGRPRLVTFCASCAHSLAAYPGHEDLGFEDGEAEAWAEALTPLSALLAGGGFGANNDAPDCVRHHKPCHAPSPDPDRVWLARAAGGRLKADAGKACCGMGGVLQIGAPELSAAVAADRWRTMGADPGDQVLTGCSGCWLQLAATATEGVAVAHWLDAVDVERS